jgi:uncharacterized protein (TIGR02996 family)
MLVVVPEVAMHPEADALLDAIWDNPQEDTPRLVYADWLQENGHEKYAEFIRVCVLLARKVLPADERRRLRQQRHRLGQQIIKERPEATQIITHCNPPNGIPFECYIVPAADFVKEWPRWWPFVQPRRLLLTNLCDAGSGVADCGYMDRVVALACEGEVTRVWGHNREDADWNPVSGILLAELAGSKHLQKLTALKIEPIVATVRELSAFAQTPLAARLTELRLWLQFWDGSREDLRVLHGGAPQQIRQFVDDYAVRLLGAQA